MTAYLKNSIIFCLLLLFVGCESQEIGNFDSEPIGKISIAHLKTLLKGNSYRISDDITIEGYVIANDLYSEYIKEIVIADQSGGIVIAIDEAQSATRFPISAHVTINCSGLQLGFVSGRVTLGERSNDGYRVERISQQNIARYILIDKGTPQSIKPKTVNIKEITSLMAGNFVAIKDVEFEDAGKSWCDKDSSKDEYTDTIRYAKDKDTNKIGIYTSQHCDYSGETIPSGYGEICGIVENIDQQPVIRIIQHNIFFRK